MSDLIGNHIVCFPTRRLICWYYLYSNDLNAFEDLLHMDDSVNLHIHVMYGTTMVFSVQTFDGS